ncbi:hypothetical protein P5673_030656, partial [Acropora cervicornis]
MADDNRTSNACARPCLSLLVLVTFDGALESIGLSVQVAAIVEGQAGSQVPGSGVMLLGSGDDKAVADFRVDSHCMQRLRKKSSEGYRRHRTTKHDDQRQQLLLTPVVLAEIEFKTPLFPKISAEDRIQ